MRIEISRSAVKALQRAAGASAAEICGLLLGREGRIEEVRACANVAADPARSFEVDPAALFAAHRAARAGGPQVLGHYHSHPTGLAEPSPRDAAQAGGEGALWLIVTADEATLWRSHPDRFEPVEMALV